MLEVEVKIKVDITKTEEKLKILGFSKGTTKYEHDVYFNGTKTDLKAEDKALRIRHSKNLDTGAEKYVLNFKGPKKDQITMTREETQFEIPGMEEGLKVINGLNFFAAGEVEKVRVHYKKDDMTCCLDRITGLGEFLEVEILADEDSYEGAVDRIKDILCKLGLSMENTTRKSYLSQLYPG